MSPVQSVLLASVVVALVLIVRLVLRRRPHEQREDTGTRTDSRVAFVLLDESRMPTIEALRDALATFDNVPATVESMEGENAVSVRLASGGEVLAMLMDAPIPGDEVERASAFSLAAYREGATIPDHTAHIVVTALGTDQSAEGLRAFTRVVAAIAESAGAIGVYWGAGGVSHWTSFFLRVAHGEGLPLPVWIGLSIVETEEARVSVLGSGMAQFGLQDLLLTCSRDRIEDGLGYYFDLLEYAVKRGAVPSSGDTLAPAGQPEARVWHAASPVSESATVWCVALDLDGTMREYRLLIDAEDDDGRFLVTLRVAAEGPRQAEEQAESWVKEQRARLIKVDETEPRQPLVETKPGVLKTTGRSYYELR